MSSTLRGKRAEKWDALISLIAHVPHCVDCRIKCTPPHFLPIEDAYDYNRDKAVNVQDDLIARSNPSTWLTDLNLIDLSAPNPVKVSVNDSGAAVEQGAGPLAGTELPLEKASFSSTVAVDVPTGQSSESHVTIAVPLLASAIEATQPVAEGVLAVGHEQPMREKCEETIHESFEDCDLSLTQIVSGVLDVRGVHRPWLGSMDLLLAPFSQQRRDMPRTMVSSVWDELSTSTDEGFDCALIVGFPNAVDSTWSDLAHRFHAARHEQQRDDDLEQAVSLSLKGLFAE